MASKARAATSPSKLSNAARDKQIVQARVEGATIREIADRFSVSVGRAHQVLARERGYLIDDTKELAGEYRARQLEQLEQVVAKWLPKVLHSEAEASELQALLKTFAHEAQLVGAFAASKTEVAGADGGAIETKSTVNLGALSTEELLALEALSKKAGG